MTPNPRAFDLIAWRDYSCSQMRIGMVDMVLVEESGGKPVMVDVQDVTTIAAPGIERHFRRIPVSAIVAIWRPVSESV